MRTRIFLIVFLSSIIILCVCLVYWLFTAKIERQLLYSSVPNLLLINSENQSVDLRTEAADYPSVLIYFNSTCRICQSESELIREEFATDSLTHFLWVSLEALEKGRLFSENFGFNALNNHFFYSDTLFTLANTFKLTGVPATFVYDTKGDLVDYYTSAVGMSELKKSIQEAHDRPR